MPSRHFSAHAAFVGRFARYTTARPTLRATSPRATTRAAISSPYRRQQHIPFSVRPAVAQRPTAHYRRAVHYPGALIARPFSAPRPARQLPRRILANEHSIFSALSCRATAHGAFLGRRPLSWHTHCSTIQRATARAAISAPHHRQRTLDSQRVQLSRNSPGRISGAPSILLWCTPCAVSRHAAVRTAILAPFNCQRHAPFSARLVGAPRPARHYLAAPRHYTLNTCSSLSAAGRA